MIEIDGNVLVETGHVGSNNAIVCTREGLVLVDTPHRPSDAIRWGRTVAGCGTALYLINTDHHIDHTMGNAFLPGTVVSHEGTRERLIDAPPSRAYIEALLGAIDPAGLMYMENYAVRVPTLTYTERMTLHAGGLDFDLIHLRGHTLNSTVVHLRQQEIAFTGDLVCEAGLPSFIDADVAAWIEAVRTIESMEVRYVVPGHGEVCGIDRVARFREQIEALVAEVEAQIDAGRDRDEVAATVTYEDNIHREADGYSREGIERTMRGSIEVIYDQILARRTVRRQRPAAAQEPAAG